MIIESSIFSNRTRTYSKTYSGQWIVAIFWIRTIPSRGWYSTNCRTSY